LVENNIAKNMCFTNYAIFKKDESICENIIEDFSHLSGHEKENMDANLSQKIDCSS